MSGEITAACRNLTQYEKLYLQWLGARSVAESWLQTIYIPLADW